MFYRPRFFVKGMQVVVALVFIVSLKGLSLILLSFGSLIIADNLRILT